MNVSRRISYNFFTISTKSCFFQTPHGVFMFQVVDSAKIIYFMIQKNDFLSKCQRNNRKIRSFIEIELGDFLLKCEGLIEIKFLVKMAFCKIRVNIGTSILDFFFFEMSGDNLKI